MGAPRGFKLAQRQQTPTVGGRAQRQRIRMCERFFCGFAQNMPRPCIIPDLTCLTNTVSPADDVLGLPEDSQFGPVTAVVNGPYREPRTVLTAPVPPNSLRPYFPVSWEYAHKVGMHLVSLTVGPRRRYDQNSKTQIFYFECIGCN